jgi:hypothetical protein
MLPELSATYGLSPAEVWEMDQQTLSAYLHHLRRRAQRGEA